IYRTLLERIRAQPGVISAAPVAFTPVGGSSWDEMVRPDGSNDASKQVYFNRAGAGYFKTMGTSLVPGRDFDARDTGTSPKVAIVNEMFQKMIFGGADPVGRLFRVEGSAGKADPVYQVVGVVRNTKYYELREEFRSIAYLAASQDDDPGTGVTIVIRT